MKKYVRIDSLEPYFRKGFIYYNPKSQQKFKDEYIRFSPDIKGGTKDILDALSFQKEHWEALSFLGGAQENTYRDKWQKAQKDKIAKIKNRYSRHRTHEIAAIPISTAVPKDNPLWEFD